MWGTFLSEPLPIDALVGRYPANKLMGRIAISYRKTLFNSSCEEMKTSGISLTFARLFPSMRQVRYALLTRAPVAGEESKLPSRCPSTCMC